MNDYTKTVLNAITEALNAGRYDVATVVTVIIVIIIFFFVISSILRFNNRSKFKKAAEDSYEKLIRKYNMSILELDLIAELTGTLKEPKKKYLLLVNKNTFRTAVQKLGDLSDEQISLVKSIEEKTGFASGVRHKDYSTTKSFTRGMPVYLETPSKEILNAEIYSVSDSDFTVKIPANHQTVKIDEMLELYCFTFYGLKTYSLKVVKAKEGLISVHHTEESMPDKRNVRLEVNIRIENDDHPETFKTFIRQLANKGAVIENPLDSLKKGDNIRLFPVNDKNDSFQISAVVEKISTVKKLVFVSFIH